MDTYDFDTLPKIQKFLEIVSDKGGHTIYFEDNKSDKELISKGFKLIGIKPNWVKPQYIDRYTGKKNSRNGVISWSHLEHRVKYIDDDCTKGIDDITTTIHFRDGTWIDSKYLASRQISGLDVSLEIVYRMRLGSSNKYGIGSQARENFAKALTEIKDQYQSRKNQYEI